MTSTRQPLGALEPRAVIEGRRTAAHFDDIPSVEILCHADLRRIGDATAPELLVGGSTITIGRGEPHFGRGCRDGRPIGDPGIGDHRVDLRWRSEIGAFEIPAHTRGNGAIRVVDHRGGARPLDAPLSPDALIATLMGRSN